MTLFRRAALVFLCGLGGVASAAAPSQPAVACQPPAAPFAEAQRKFHPGHYVSLGRGYPRSDFSGALVKGVTGVQMRYRWADLEPAEGHYDLSVIARDLEAAKRSGVQLVVLIEDKSFKDELPTPAYLRAKYTLRNRANGYTALRWDPYVNDRLQQLVANLGAEFDCHPHFEGVAFQESSLSLDDKVLDANGYTPEKYRDALISLLRSSAKKLPRSRVFWYMNFLPEKQGYIGEIADAVIGTGVVMGGPDILPDNPALATRVYPFYDKFEGRLRLFNSMQHDSYRHRHNAVGRSGYWSMDDLFVFARDELHVDYVFWEYRTWRQPPDSHDWTDAREVIARYATFGSSRSSDSTK